MGIDAKNHPFGWFLVNPAPCYFPLTSIIAAAGLNFGVRDGNQCITCAKSTGLAARSPRNHRSRVAGSGGIGTFVVPVWKWID